MSRVLQLLTALFIVALVLAAGTDAAEKKNKKFPVPHDHPFIKHVKGQNFREEVVDPTIPVVVEFFGRDKASKALAPNYEEMAEAMQGYATFKVMDATSDEGAGVAQMFGIQQFPAITLFNPEMIGVDGGQEGQYMKLPVGYSGTGDTESLVKWGLESIAGHQIEIMEDDHDIAVFLSRYTHWDIPKVLLFTDQEVTSPSYKTMSHEFRYRAMFGLVPSTSTEVINRYGITEFPTLMVITAMGEDSETMNMAKYENGNPSIDDIRTFIDKFALSGEKRNQIQGVFMEEEAKLRKKEAEEAKMIKALPPIIAKDAKTWEKECLKRSKGHCIAVFLDGLDNVPMQMLHNVSKKLAPRVQTQIQIIVVDGLYNYEMVSYFGMVNGLPDLVFVIPKTKTYQNMIGSFSEKSIMNFYLDKVGKVRGKKYDLKKVPQFALTPAPEADEEEGKDGDEL